MSESNIPIYVILSTETMMQSQVDEINQLTRELVAALENEPEAVKSVSMGGREDLPQGTKVALEAILAEQLILQLTPIVVSFTLGTLGGAIKSLSQKMKKPVNAKVIVGNREVRISPTTTQQELNRAIQQVKAASELSPNRRFALVVGNSSYQDSRLPNLQSAVVDAERFASILADPAVGAFDQVETLLNKSHDVIKNNIEKFFKNKQREDLLVLYFSGHGIKSQGGQLFLAAQDTSSDLLRSTGVDSNFIKENMGESGSQRQVLILDCCYGGAIVEGAKSDMVVGQSVNSILSFKPSGFGKVIITASEAMQYAFDGQRVEGQTQNSLFTRYLIEGLKTGSADADNDGLVDIDELYQYAYKKVTPQQTPNISSTSQEGRMYIGLNPNPSIQMAKLDESLQRAMVSSERVTRVGAVTELEQMLKSHDPSVVLAAEVALQKMTTDDSRIVADRAQQVLDQYQRVQTVSIPEAAQQPAMHKSSLPAAKIASAPLPAAPRTPVQYPASPTRPAMPPAGRTRNVNAGGCLNTIVPGLAYAVTGKWASFILTFVLTVIGFVVLTYVALNISGYCVFVVLLGTIGFLFFQGRTTYIKDNQSKQQSR